MNAEKVGALIRQLRIQKGMTQKELAEQLFVSEQAVSKWERALGCPDVSLLAGLAKLLNVDVKSLLSGEIEASQHDGGNMRRIRFYTCPECGNVITMTGNAEVSCCGRQLEALKPAACDEAHKPHIEHVDGELYITFDHAMEKQHYIQFVACVKFERLLLVRLYPEQGAQLHMPYMPRAAYYVGCSNDGLFVHRA